VIAVFGFLADAEKLGLRQRGICLDRSAFVFAYIMELRLTSI